MLEHASRVGGRSETRGGPGACSSMCDDRARGSGAAVLEPLRVVPTVHGPCLIGGAQREERMLRSTEASRARNGPLGNVSRCWSLPGPLFCTRWATA